MSSQSAQHRTASQATVNNYKPAPVERPQAQQSNPKWLALALMVPASALGWLLADLVTRFLS
jgi:hypothetical protein